VILLNLLEEVEEEEKEEIIHHVVEEVEEEELIQRVPLPTSRMNHLSLHYQLQKLKKQ